MLDVSPCNHIKRLACLWEAAAWISSKGRKVSRLCWMISCPNSITSRSWGFATWSGAWSWWSRTTPFSTNRDPGQRLRPRTLLAHMKNRISRVQVIAITSKYIDCGPRARSRESLHIYNKNISSLQPSSPRRLYDSREFLPFGRDLGVFRNCF